LDILTKALNKLCFDPPSDSWYQNMSNCALLSTVRDKLQTLVKNQETSVHYHAVGKDLMSRFFPTKRRAPDVNTLPINAYVQGVMGQDEETNVYTPTPVPSPKRPCPIPWNIKPIDPIDPITPITPIDPVQPKDQSEDQTQEVEASDKAEES